MSRLSPEEAINLLERADSAELMGRADSIRRERHGPRTYFVHSLNINPTNLCENRCELCAFWREPDADDAYLVTLDDARKRMLAAQGQGLTDMHIVGGCTPQLGLDYFESLLRLSRTLLPEAMVQGMTAVEVHYLAEQARLPVADVLERLKAAGLGSMPGGGAEILSDDVRQRICPNKISTDQWLAVHERAHTLGIPTNATMLFGHVEEPEHVVEHLRRLRELQDRTGGVQAFVALPFHPKGTKLPVAHGPSGHRIARTVAIARIFLDNVPHVRVLANYTDRKLLQVLTHSGADDVGGTSMDERIAKAAGAPSDHRFTSIDDMRQFLTDLALEPVLVNSRYEEPSPASPSPAALPKPAPTGADGLRRPSEREGAPLPSGATAQPLRQRQKLVEAVLAKAQAGDRLSPSEGVALMESATHHQLGQIAHQRRLAAAPGDRVGFTIDRNLSFTNVCEVGCAFCAFHVAPGDERAYTMTVEEIVDAVAESAARGATQILIQGGLNPALDLSFYERMLRGIKETVDIWVHSLSAPEVHYLARSSGLPISETLKRLRDAGLDSLPGGGAEILVQGVRDRVSPRKATADQWFDVMAAAHELGMKSTATMVYGLGETAAQRIEHLERVRELQDRTGGFTAFIPWSFQPAHTRLPLRAQTGVEYLRMVAISRLMLDNIPHIQAGWLTEGPDVAQLALSFGADDWGGVLMEERVVRAAGAGYWVTPDEVIALIRDGGFTPVQRTTQYEALRVFE